MDINEIEKLILHILKNNHDDIHKHNILHYDNRLNFACPYCGDSIKNVYAKRGNLYLNTLLYICFNCGKITDLLRLLKDFDINVDVDKKLELYEFIKKSIKNKNDNIDIFKFDSNELFDIDFLSEIFDRKIIPITDFSKVNNGGVVYDYLIKRNINPNNYDNLYQGKYWYTDKYYEWNIIILNKKDDKIISMQIRNLKNGVYRKFKYYNYEYLLKCNINMFNNSKYYEIKDESIILYNSLSNIFNIFKINLNDKITIFEGYIDSLHFPNSVSLVGVNSNSKILESGYFDIQYFFDNDDAGYKISEKKLKSGYSVFLWKKFIHETSKKYKNGSEIINFLNKIKDLNELSHFFKNPYFSLELWKYFSNDKLDLIWIPKTKK